MTRAGRWPLIAAVLLLVSGCSSTTVLVSSQVTAQVSAPPSASDAVPRLDLSIGGLLPLFEGDRLVGEKAWVTSPGIAAGWHAVVRSAAPTRLGDYRTWLTKHGWELTSDRGRSMSARKGQEYVTAGIADNTAITGSLPYAVTLWHAQVPTAVTAAPSSTQSGS